MSENLWPQIDPIKIITPKALMIEQASFLAESTKQIIKGEILTNPTGVNDQIILDFRIVAPALNNYKITIFQVQHGVLLYPLTVTFEKVTTKAESEKAFKDLMKEIFNSETTKKLVTSLYSQSIEK
jgi:hypothetical protein